VANAYKAQALFVAAFWAHRPAPKVISPRNFLALGKKATRAHSVSAAHSHKAGGGLMSRFRISLLAHRTHAWLQKNLMRTIPEGNFVPGRNHQRRCTKPFHYLIL